MKKTAGILFLLIIQMLNLMATEKQSYRVVHVEKDFEIRFYPSAILATVYSEARSYRELSVPGFRQLAGYIFGGNQSGTKIAMTSPVHMDINDSLSSMSFVMPSSYEMEKLPAPENAGVSLGKTADEYVAALRFGGYASDKRIQHYSERLKRELEERKIPYEGRFRYLGYNPPYQPFGRRNEIIVSVKWSE
jgi:hypothetical protein